jgi:hypothetical protein
MPSWQIALITARPALLTRYSGSLITDTQIAPFCADCGRLCHTPNAAPNGSVRGYRVLYALVAIMVRPSGAGNRSEYLCIATPGANVGSCR